MGKNFAMKAPLSIYIGDPRKRLRSAVKKTTFDKKNLQLLPGADPEGGAQGAVAPPPRSI